MADATNEVRLWRYNYVSFNGDRVIGPWRDGQPHHSDSTDAVEWYIARPRADDDAREERLKRAEAALREIAYAEGTDPVDASWDEPGAAGIARTALNNPTPDDRKGEDGAWVERSAE